MRRALACASVAGSMAACVVSAETSEEGKPCPCSSAYECDQTTGMCRKPVVCEPRFSVDDFHAKWTTPNTIRWDWVPRGAAADHFGYRLIVGQNRDEVASGSGNVVIFDASINPELGGYDVPDQNGFKLVSFTIADRLAPATDYHGRLEVKDAFGCTFSSPIVAARTQPAPTQSVVIFDEQVAGYTSPCGLAPTDGCGTSGERCLKCSSENLEPGKCLWDVDNPGTSDIENGWESLYVIGQHDFGTVDPEAFESGRAYLELDIGLRSSVPVYYSEIDFVSRGEDCVDDLGRCEYYIAPCLAAGEWHSLGGLVLRAREEGYDTIQIPLTWFVSDVFGPMTLDRFASPLQSGLRIAASFLLATEVDFDRIAIRW